MYDKSHTYKCTVVYSSIHEIWQAPAGVDNQTVQCMTFNELTQILVQIAPMVHIWNPCRLRGKVWSGPASFQMGLTFTHSPHNFPSEQSETRRLGFFEKWRARHLTVLSEWECFLRALFFTFFQISLKSSSFAYYQSSKPILIQGRLILQRQLPNNAWNSTSFALHGNFFKLKRCQIKVHNQL